jgi:hypothetical protein
MHPADRACSRASSCQRSSASSGFGTGHRSSASNSSRIDTFQRSVEANSVYIATDGAGPRLLRRRLTCLAYRSRVLCASSDALRSAYARWRRALGGCSTASRRCWTSSPRTWIQNASSVAYPRASTRPRIVLAQYL